MPKSAQARNPQIDAANKELDEHFQKTMPTAPDSLQVLKFSLHQRGSLALIQLPYRSDTPEFAIACRSFRKPAEDAGVTCLFFDSRQKYESFTVDDDFALAKLGLMRIKR